jgi:hypothetical protein
MRRIDRGRALSIAAAIVSVGVTLFPMFALQRVFFLDWVNHLWLIEYFGEYLRRHAAPPDVVNTQQLVGSPVTILYAGKFYAMAGAISAFLGAAVTVRLLACGVLLLQFWQVHRAMIRLGAARAVAITAAVCVTWAIYPLTNFYNRGALTEFFAVAFLTCALAALLCVVHGRADRQSTVMSGFMFTAAAVTHPLTAAFGALLLAVVGTIGIVLADPQRRLGLAIFGAVTALLAGLVLAPWLFAFASFRHDLPLVAADVNAATFRIGGFFPDSIDSIWSRLSPIALRYAPGATTPYLDAQISVPLLFLGTALGIGALGIAAARRSGPDASGARRARWMGWSAMMLAGLVLAISVAPSISGWLGGVFDILQFPYRLTAYVNLWLLVAVISFAAIAADLQRRKPLTWCIAIAAMLAVAGVATKLYHANLMARRPTPGEPYVVARAMETGFGTEDPAVAWLPLPARSTAHLNRLPTVFYAGSSYSLSGGYAVPSAAQAAVRRFVAFPVLDGQDFGRVAPLVLDLAAPTLVVTNVQPFRWNELLIDGAAVAPAETMVADMAARDPVMSDRRLAIMVPAGRHELSVRFAGSDAWRILDRASWAIFLLWLAACLAVALRGRRAREARA